MKSREDELWDALAGGPTEDDIKPKEPKPVTTGRRRAALKRVAELPPTVNTQTPFQLAHPQVVKWLTGYTGTFPFYLSLRSQYERRGDLSEKQLESVYRAIERDGGARPSEHANALAKLEAVWNTLRALGLGDRCELEVNELRRAIVVDQSKTLAAQAPAFTLTPGERIRVSKFFARKLGEDSGLTRAHFVFEVKEVLRETPKAYLVKLLAVSQRSGVCCICGLTLTNPESVSKGIGPVCGDGYELDWNSDRDVLLQLADKLKVVATVIEVWLPKSAIKERLLK